MKYSSVFASCCVVFFDVITFEAQAQCAVCARTTEQLDSSAAEGFNFGVLYLMLAPLLIIAVTGYLWYRSTRRKTPM